MRPLSAKQRAFADAWNGFRTGRDAARAAGYAGNDTSLATTASKLLKHPGVRARILERLGPSALDAKDPGGIHPEPPPIQPGSPLVKGRGRGTATERIELLMSIGRSKDNEARDRITAILAAAELEGERRPTRAKAGPPAPIAAPIAPPIASKDRPKLALVMSDADTELTHG